MEESEASTSQCLVPSPVRPGQEVLPHVSRRVLEYANHLARNRSEVARDMLRLRVPTPDQLARHTAALQVGPACTCTHNQAGLSFSVCNMILDTSFFLPTGCQVHGQHMTHDRQQGGFSAAH